MVEASKVATASVGNGATTLAVAATYGGVSLGQWILEIVVIAFVIAGAPGLGAVYGTKYAREAKAKRAEEQLINEAEAIRSVDLDKYDFIIGVDDPSSPMGPTDLLYGDNDGPTPVSEEDAIASALGTDRGQDVLDPTSSFESLEEVAHGASTTLEDGHRVANNTSTTERSENKLPLVALPPTNTFSVTLELQVYPIQGPDQSHTGAFNVACSAFFQGGKANYQNVTCKWAMRETQIKEEGGRILTLQNDSGIQGLLEISGLSQTDGIECTAVAKDVNASQAVFLGELREAGKVFNDSAFDISTTLAANCIASDDPTQNPAVSSLMNATTPLGTPTFPTLLPAVDSANPTALPVEGTESPMYSLNSGTTKPSGASVTEWLARIPTDGNHSPTGSPVQEGGSPDGSCLDSAGYQYTMSYEYDADTAEYIYSYTVNDHNRNLKNALSHWNIHFGMYHP